MDGLEGTNGAHAAAQDQERPHLQDARPLPGPRGIQERDFFDNLLVRIHFIIVMVRWTGLAPLELEFTFPGSLTSTSLGGIQPESACPKYIGFHGRMGSTRFSNPGSLNSVGSPN